MTIDVQRATAVINRAIEHHMYRADAMPEADGAKIETAESIIAKCRQAEEVAKVVGKHNMPTWPAVEAVLFEAHVTMGSGDEPPADVAPEPSSAAEPAERVARIERPDGSWEFRVPTGHHEAPPSPDAVAPVEAVQGESREELSSTPQTVDPPPIKVDGDGLTIQRQVREVRDSDPKKGEVWADSKGNEWEIVSYSGGMSAMVKSVSTGEGTLVPAGFLKTRKIAVEDEAAQPNELDQNDPAHVLSTPRRQASLGPLEESLIDEAQARLEGAQAKLKEGVPARSPFVPEDARPGDQVVVNGTTFYVTADGNQLTGTPVVRPSTDPEPQKTEATSHWEQTDDGLPDVRAVDDREDNRYQKIVDDVNDLYAPHGMPVPRDLTDPPSEASDITPEDLTRVDGVQLRKLHSQFAALAARAKFLHNKNAALARRCDVYRKLALKAAMRQAREELGKGATVTEVTQLAEDDEQVMIWEARKRDHADEADAYKTFAEIYAENVAMLSRDGSLRELQARGA